MLCSCVDRAELLRFVHPSERVRNDAANVVAALGHEIALLNTSEDLYRAVSSVCMQSSIERFDEEQVRVAHLYKSELEAHGVHLGAHVQEQVVQLQTAIADTAHRFVCGEFGLLENLLELRERLAQVLGFECYADYVTPQRVIGSKSAALSLLDSIESMPSPKEKIFFVPQGPIALEQVLSTLKQLTEKMIGLKVTKISSSKEAWHPSVQCWQVGERGKVFLDLLARPNKADQPATFMLQFDVLNTHVEGGQNECAMVTAVSNPANLSRHEVESLFHEVCLIWKSIRFFTLYFMFLVVHLKWGHVLAAVCSSTRYQQLASTRAALDFVETPSMLFERLAWHPLALPECAGVKLQPRVSRVDGDDIRGQLRLARSDILLHSAQWRDHLPSTTPFAHLAPYGCGYYSYLMCRLFASNLYHLCLKEDLSGGIALREGLLRHGGARDPLNMITECTGVSPFHLSHFHQ